MAAAEGPAGVWHSPRMTVFDDLGAEQERLEEILAGLDEAQWVSPSAAEGWTVADVVLHLAQSEEAVEAAMTGGHLRTGLAVAHGNSMDERADAAVRAERAAPAEVFGRWRRARRAAMTALTAGDPEQTVGWVTGPVRPATLATTRLAEHWAHGLDITGPLGIEFPDTDRLRHIAWLAHRTLPYALAVAGESSAVAVRCELTGPGGSETWRYGSADADSAIAGPAGEFCRVAVRRLAPADARLTATGPHGATALQVLRTYAQ
jgi:uncharacterized protein (TIGR03084 family)